jgi:hypothetical protein
MTTILRVIPNSVYERLLEDGSLETTYPKEKADSYNKLVENVPIALRDRARNILNALVSVKNFSWCEDFKLCVNNSMLENSSIVDLVTHLVMQSERLYKLEGSSQFVSALKHIPPQLYTLPPAITSTSVQQVGSGYAPHSAWVRFEDKFV